MAFCVFFAANGAAAGSLQIAGNKIHFRIIAELFQTVDELHMGMSEVNEKPLFEIGDRFDSGPQPEGSVREDEMLFGTYLHGIFDRKPFRKYFLSFVSHDGRRVNTADTRDYDEIMEENIDKLADVFEANMDVDALMGILGGSQ